MLSLTFTWEKSSPPRAIRAGRRWRSARSGMHLKY